VLTNQYVLSVMVTTLVLLVLNISWNFVLGVAGVWNFGQLAIYALGGYGAGIIMLHTALPPWLAVLAGGLVGTFAAVLLAFPTLRLYGIYTSLLTFAFAVVIQYVIVNDGSGLTGGTFPPVKEVNLPAAEPLVLATGGTSLNASRTTGTYLSETGWGLPFGSPGTQFQASGGGFSRRFAHPGYQNGVPGIAATRGVPDVSADASPHTGMTVVIGDGGHKYTIRNSGGTSTSAPIWAGLIALADQYAGRHLGFVNPAIYRIARSGSYHDAFHDITEGNSTPSFPGHTIKGYMATPGWDPVTGWGSPNAQALIPLLAHDSNR